MYVETKKLNKYWKNDGKTKRMKTSTTTFEDETKNLWITTDDYLPFNMYSKINDMNSKSCCLTCDVIFDSRDITKCILYHFEEELYVRKILPTPILQVHVHALRNSSASAHCPRHNTMNTNILCSFHYGIVMCAEIGYFIPQLGLSEVSSAVVNLKIYASNNRNRTLDSWINYASRKFVCGSRQGRSHDHYQL